MPSKSVTHFIFGRGNGAMNAAAAPSGKTVSPSVRRVVPSVNRRRSPRSFVPCFARVARRRGPNIPKRTYYSSNGKVLPRFPHAPFFAMQADDGWHLGHGQGDGHANGPWNPWNYLQMIYASAVHYLGFPLHIWSWDKQVHATSPSFKLLLRDQLQLL